MRSGISLLNRYILSFLFVDKLQDADVAGTEVLKSGFVKDTYSSLFVLSLPHVFENKGL
jgi:hypothetical protein